MQLMHINSLEIVSKPYNKSCIFFKDWDKGFLRSVYYGTLLTSYNRMHYSSKLQSLLQS